MALLGNGIIGQWHYWAVALLGKLTYFILIVSIDRDKDGHALMRCPYPSCNKIVRVDRPHDHTAEDEKVEEVEDEED